jgi:glutamyl-Q tRNA(Asp) synthetase
VSGYVGRFAPSPTGLLHAGSLVAALASWLDAKAHNGRWLVRIEDIDRPRCIPGADAAMLAQLAVCGLVSDGEVVWQSQRGHLYEQALSRLHQQQLTYACSCSRQDIARALKQQGVQTARHQALIYPGTCREATPHTNHVAWRCKLPSPGPTIQWTDRQLGLQQQDLSTDVGDFVLWRKDQLWAYQLAVVVDDAAQAITHVVRGHDLADNTARQVWLQRCLQLPTPSYLHTPLVVGADGDKLSKQHGAQALALDTPTKVHLALQQAAAHLHLPKAPHTNTAEQLGWWCNAWRALYPA